jgi:hypothetical protein
MACAKRKAEAEAVKEGEGEEDQKARKKLRLDSVKEKEGAPQKTSKPVDFPWDREKVNKVATELGFFSNRKRFLCRTGSIIDACMKCAACLYEPCFECGGTYQKHIAKCAFAAGNYIQRGFMWFLDQQLLERSYWIEDWLEGVGEGKEEDDDEEEEEESPWASTSFDSGAATAAVSK